MSARHCDVCGARLPERPPTVCAACGAEHWLNAKPCANALVLSDGLVLLLRRARAPWRDAWCAPGGFCDGAEHPAAAAEREIMEEAGIRARVTALLGIWIDPYSDDPADREAESISVAYYLAERCDDAPPEPFDVAETAEVGWFPLDDLPEPLAPPGTLAQVVEAARAAIASGAARMPLPDAHAGDGQSDRW